MHMESSVMQDADSAPHEDYSATQKMVEALQDRHSSDEVPDLPSD